MLVPWLVETMRFGASAWPDWPRRNGLKSSGNCGGVIAKSGPAPRPADCRPPSPAGRGSAGRLHRPLPGGDVLGPRTATATDDGVALGHVAAGVLGQLVRGDGVLPAPVIHVVAPVVRIDADR